MDTNDMWYQHVEALTKRVSYLLTKIEELEERSNYYENVLITLITALKEGGIIVDDENGKNEIPS